MKKVIFFLVAASSSLLWSTPFRRHSEVYKFPDLPEKRCYFFSERQPYVPYQNFMHYWIDRPLFTDTTLRHFENARKEGFLRDVQIAKQYGLDGFGAIAYYGYHLEDLRYLKEAKVKDYSHLFVMTGTDYKVLLPHVRNILKSQFTFRINGVPVFYRYGGSKKIVENLQRLRNDLKQDLRLFGPMPIGSIHNDFYKNGKKFVSQDVLTKFKQDCQKILDSCGGMSLWMTDYQSSPRSAYGLRLVKTKLYQNYILPVVKELMSMERNKDKLIGFTIYPGYTNHLNGPLHNEYGTEHYRYAIEEGIKAAPDLILLFEWNEANENTSHQPTVSNGRVLERLMNFYKQKLNRLKLSPRPGDDTTIPNFVLSGRQVIQLGEELHYELLNIPDTDLPGKYKVRLKLKDHTGKIRFIFPWENFEQNQLQTVSFTLPSENFSTCRLLSPEVEVVSSGSSKTFTGFDYTLLSPVGNTNYKYTRSALRELYTPDKLHFSVTPMTNKKFSLSAEITGSLPLRSLEILDCRTNILAADKHNEFDRSKYILIRGTFTTGLSGKTLTGDIKVLNSENWSIRSANNAWECFRSGLKFSDVFKTNTFFGGRGTFLIKIPRSEASNALLSIDYERIGKAEFKISDILKFGVLSRVLNNEVCFTIENMQDLPDYPHPLENKTAHIKAILERRGLAPVFQLRAISMDGQIFRSVPVYHPKKDEKFRMVNVYSDYHQKYVTAMLQTTAAPEVEMNFSPEHGDLLSSKLSPKWNIQLGGGWHYAQPVWAKRKQFLPADCKEILPVWQQEDHRWILNFNGKGAYMILPQEYIPRHTDFTFEFEVKFASTTDQVLLRPGSVYDEYRGAFGLVVSGGKLQGVLNNFPKKIFKTNLSVPIGKYCQITLAKKGKFLHIGLDNNFEKFLCPDRGRLFQSSTFGGDLIPGFGLPANAGTFHGSLRAMKIKYY